MMGFIRDLRLIPVALIASACLLALKTADLVLDHGLLIAANQVPASDAEVSVIRTTPDVPQSSGSGLSWAQQMFNFPDGNAAAPARRVTPAPADKAYADITGSVTVDPADHGGKGDNTGATAAKTEPAKPSGKPDKPPVGTIIPLENTGQPSGAERAILERLQERRQELDTRSRELDIRESLIKTAEKRMEARLTELKEVESRIAVATQQKDDAQAARFKGLVTMYESMKPRDAAKIFDRLEIGVLMEVASKINPRQMAEILAQMSPEAAERLTVELASEARQIKQDGKELPKIEGHPTTP